MASPRSARASAEVAGRIPWLAHCSAASATSLGIAAGEPVFRYANIVLKTRPNGIGATRQHPTDHFGLVTANAGGGPRRLRQHARKLRAEKIENVRLRRQRILYPHHELHVRALVDHADVGKPAGAMDMGKIEHLDFR